MSMSSFLQPRNLMLAKRLALVGVAFVALIALTLLAARVLFKELNVVQDLPLRTWEPAGPMSTAARVSRIAELARSAKPVEAAPATKPASAAKIPFATAEKPDFGHPAHRAGEDDVTYSLRQRFAAAYQSFGSEGKLSEAQDLKMRRVLFHAQVNYALWMRFFVKQAFVADMQAGKANQTSETYVEQAIAAVGRFIPAAAAPDLSKRQRALLAEPTYRLLASGSGIMSSPFDVDEMAAAGLAADATPAQLKSAIQTRLEAQIPGDSEAAQERRQSITSLLRI